MYVWIVMDLECSEIFSVFSEEWIVLHPEKAGGGTLQS